MIIDIRDIDTLVIWRYQQPLFCTVDRLYADPRRMDLTGVSGNPLGSAPSFAIIVLSHHSIILFGEGSVWTLEKGNDGMYSTDCSMIAQRVSLE